MTNPRSSEGEVIVDGGNKSEKYDVEMSEEDNENEVVTDDLKNDTKLQKNICNSGESIAEKETMKKRVLLF